MRLIGILHRIIAIDKQLRRELRTVQSPTKRTSNKSKLKASKRNLMLNTNLLNLSHQK